MAPADHPVRPDEGLQEHHPRTGAGRDLGRGRGQARGAGQADEEGGSEESFRQTCEEILTLLSCSRTVLKCYDVFQKITLHTA